MIPLGAFFHARVVDQVIYCFACAFVVYGIVRTRGKRRPGILDLLVVLAFFVLALSSMGYIAAGGAL